MYLYGRALCASGEERGRGNFALLDVSASGCTLLVYVDEVT